MADYSKFLEDWFAQLNLNMMPDGAIARFNALKKSNNLTKEMKEWDGKIGKNLPEPNDAYNGGTYMDEEEWKKLFLTFQSVFRAMNRNKDKLQEEFPKAFTYFSSAYGPNKLFNNATIDGATKDLIKKLVDFLENPKSSKFGEYIARDKGVKNYHDFIEQIKQGKYENDEELQQTIVSIASTIDYNKTNFLTKETSKDVKNPNYIEDDGIRDLLQNTDFGKIETGFNDAEKTISPVRLDLFKTIYPDLLTPLYKKDEVRQAVKSYGGQSIVYPLNKAIQKTNYSDGDNKLVQNLEDEKNGLQKFEAFVEDFYNDHIGKLRKRALYHNYYMKDTAKPITLAIIGKVKPTDGLEKLLGEADNIKNSLQAKTPIAAKHFDFMIKSLKYVQEGGMKKAIEGALRNGKQMNAVVQEIIKYAVQEDKIDEAKTTLEVLAMMRYGYLSSRMREDLNKANWTFFGDKSLSWNKYDSLKFMTGVADKAIKGVSMLGFEVAHLGVNMFRRNGLDFGTGKDRLEKMMQSNKKQNKDEIEKFAKEQEILTDLLSKSQNDGASQEEQNILNDRIDENKKEIDKLNAGSNKDKIVELMAFWNFVNSKGAATDFNIFRSHKKAQKHFDTAKDNLFNAYLKGYSKSLAA